jgi:hypothetical protein
MISRDKGQILGQLPFRRFVVRPGNDRTDRLFLSTESGMIICLRQIGHNFPRYHRYPDRLPLLPELEPDESAETKPTEPAAEAE